MLVLPLAGLERVDLLLRDDRAGDGGQGEQEQQDEGGAHRGQLAPAEAQQLAQAELAGPAQDRLLARSRHTLTWKSLMRWICSHATASAHQPGEDRDADE